jgi:hypothetical protein
MVVGLVRAACPSGCPCPCPYRKGREQTFFSCDCGYFQIRVGSAFKPHEVMKIQGRAFARPKGGRSRDGFQISEATEETTGRRAHPRGAALTPDSPLLFTKTTMMTNLVYAITRRTPVSQKTLKWAMRAQSLLNERSAFPQDHLNLVPLGGATERPALNFPFLRIAPMKIGPYSAPEPFNDTSAGSNPNAVAAGTTKCRDLWSAHVVVAFLRVLSEQNPEIVIELTDETGQFVIPMSVFIRAGRFEINRTFLNAQRERALETSGDPQTGTGFLWAESRALNGEYLTDVAVADYMEVPEFVFDMNLEDHRGATVGELALHFVRSALSEVEPVPSR